MSQEFDLLELTVKKEEDIFLDHDVPHIRIRPKRNRQIKSTASIREIPLVGVSLDMTRNDRKTL